MPQANCVLQVAVEYNTYEVNDTLVNDSIWQKQATWHAAHSYQLR